MMATIAAGNEFLVNTAIYGGQQLAESSTSVAVGAAGDFLVTYDGFGPGDQQGVFVRRYDAAGTAVGDLVRANITVDGVQQHGTAALAANGDFVVVWNGRGPGDSNGIFARRFTAGGASDEILVNETTGNDQHSASIAMAADGSFVVAWSGNGTGDNQGIFIRRFSAAGQPLSGEVRINTTTALGQQTPSIAMAEDGSFVVAWASQLQDGSGWGVFAQRCDAQGAGQGTEFRVNTTTAGDQLAPKVAMAADGQFVVSWTGSDGDGSGVFAQQYSATGAAVGSEFRVNTTTAGYQFDSHVAMNARGNFFVTWTSLGQDGAGYGVYGQNFTADGARDGVEYLVANTVAGHQQNSSVGADNQGNLVIAWSGMGAADGSGVMARRFVPDRDVVDPVISAALVSDTGLSNSDRITQDPTVRVSFDDQSFITRLRASLQNPTTTPTVPSLVDVDIPDDFRGPILFDQAILEQINGGPLVDGQLILRVEATDEEGNVSDVFEFTYTLDRIAPLAPASIDLLASHDSGVSNTDNLTNIVRPSFIVAAVAGQVVQLFADGNLVGQAIAPTGGNTNVAANFDIGDGVHIFTAKAYDVAGNESPMSTASLTVTIDTVAPENVPTGLDLIDSSDSGVSSTDNITNDNTPTIRVNTVAGDRVGLYVDGLLVAQQVATGATLEITPDAPLTDGARNITAVTLDDAGNASAFSTTLTVTIDTAGPEAPLLSLAPGSDTGNSPGDGVTRDTTPTIRVRSEVGNIIKLTVETTTLGDETVGAGGFVDITLPAQPEGSRTISAVAIDPAGNTGTPATGNSALLVVIDTLRIDLVSASDSGVGNADNVTNENLATLQVTAPPLSTVSITIDGNAAGTQMADATGVAVFVTPLMADGVHIIRATAVDVDGINRGPSAALALTVDTSDPTVADPIDDVTVTQDAANTNIPLTGLFADIDSLGTVVRFNTAAGVYDVQLYNTAAPLHVQNFLNYVNGGDYNGTVYHRVVSGFVAQGGQERTDGTNIPTDPPVQNEYLISNTVGTIALAKLGGNPNSGTSQFFFSLADNTDNLNNQNGGFTAFGQVLGNGLAAVIATPQGGVINSVTQLMANDRVLTYSVMSNTNNSLVEASVVNGNVVLDYKEGQTGSAEITVRATDLAGNFVEDTFTVTVNPSGSLMSTSAAGGGSLDAAALSNLATSELTPEMAAVMAQAVARWTSAGLNATGIAALDNASVKLADLPDGYLGYTLGDTIWLDIDADGQGWFVDSSPADDQEFVADIAGQLRATSGPAAGGVDLLSAMAHEMGHVLGSGHEQGGLMSNTLATGVRELPTAALIDALLAE